MKRTIEESATLFTQEGPGEFAYLLMSGACMDVAKRKSQVKRGSALKWSNGKIIPGQLCGTEYVELLC